MGKRSESRFDATTAVQSASVDETGRLELQFRDAQGKGHVVSVPLGAAVALARLICDVHQGTPFLQNRTQPPSKQR